MNQMLSGLRLRWRRRPRRRCQVLMPILFQFQDLMRVVSPLMLELTNMTGIYVPTTSNLLPDLASTQFPSTSDLSLKRSGLLS